MPVLKMPPINRHAGSIDAASRIPNTLRRVVAFMKRLTCFEEV